MKKFTVILLIIMGIVILLGSVSHSWAGDSKKANFRFDVNFDDKGNITGVDRWDATRTPPGMVPAETRVEVRDKVIKDAGAILIFKDEDPCVVIGGKKYCW